MTISQRSVVAAPIANLKKGIPKSPKKLDESLSNTLNSDFPLIDSKGVSQLEATKLQNVSVDSVKQAKKVLDKGVPELVKEVEEGNLAICRHRQSQ